LAFSGKGGWLRRQIGGDRALRRSVGGAATSTKPVNDEDDGGVDEQKVFLVA